MIRKLIQLSACVTLLVSVDFAGATVVIIDNDPIANNTAQNTHVVFGGTGTYTSDFKGLAGGDNFNEWAYRNTSTQVYYDSYSQTNGELATFTFTGLEPGNYYVWEYHRDYGVQDTAAPIKVYNGDDAGDPLLGTNIVNQDVHSAGALFNDQALTGINFTYAWLPLTAGTGAGQYYTISGNALTVEIGHGNSTTRADAIRIAAVPEPTSLGLLAAGGLMLLGWRRR